MSARAIILAAGTGTRLMPLTADRPKVMVELDGRSLLERQLGVMRALGVDDVTVIAGHHEKSIPVHGLRKVVNPRYGSTNMVTSLFCAESVMSEDADLVVSYGDIVYQRDVLERLLLAKDPIAVCIDQVWRDYWSRRMPDPLSDAETLKLGEDGRIVELGKKAVRYEDIQGQYIGLFKLRADQIGAVKRFYRELDRHAVYDGKSFDGMYMTTFLQALISAGFELRPVFIRSGWMEMDTLADIDLYRSLRAQGRLEVLYDEHR